VLEVIRLLDGRLVRDGNDGALSVFDRPTLTMTNSVPLHDARWVDVVDGKVVVVQGTPGRLSVFAEGSLELLGSYPFTGSDMAESKSTVQVVGEKAFIAAGNGGVQILRVNTGKVVGTVPLPDSDVLGLDWSGVVTNAVAVDEDLLFISNGIAGVYVAQGSRDFDETGSEEPLQIRLLGRLQFDNLESANHVAYKNRYLVIASGAGGIKTVEIRVN
jgi:outer membrane protein assembly factor BamB